MANKAVTTLPQNIEAEMGILGSILLDKGALIRIGDIVTKDDFYKAKHRIMDYAILNVFQKHQEISPYNSPQVYPVSPVDKKISSKAFQRYYRPCR